MPVGRGSGDGARARFQCTWLFYILFRELIQGLFGNPHVTSFHFRNRTQTGQSDNLLLFHFFFLISSLFSFSIPLARWNPLMRRANSFSNAFSNVMIYWILGVVSAKRSKAILISNCVMFDCFEKYVLIVNFFFQNS